MGKDNEVENSGLSLVIFNCPTGEQHLADAKQVLTDHKFQISPEHYLSNALIPAAFGLVMLNGWTHEAIGSSGHVNQLKRDLAGNGIRSTDYPAFKYVSIPLEQLPNVKPDDVMKKNFPPGMTVFMLQ
ncbi:hypothetical protein HY468_01255 [Candidatus Roizmanbacteria bacterium]|nr:hypothetical protein [Candidatus Roizmanbacteria bacterium]